METSNATYTVNPCKECVVKMMCTTGCQPLATFLRDTTTCWNPTKDDTWNFMTIADYIRKGTINLYYNYEGELTWRMSSMPDKFGSRRSVHVNDV